MYDNDMRIAESQPIPTDPLGHMALLDRWSPRLASRIAAEEGIALEEEHWLVIYCLRERFRTEGPALNARQLTRELEREFADVGGRRYLYWLFPHGPLVQACRIAGVPLPTGSVDTSFGSVH